VPEKWTAGTRRWTQGLRCLCSAAPSRSCALNRPAILMLNDERCGSQVVLRELHDDTAPPADRQADSHRASLNCRVIGLATLCSCGGPDQGCAGSEGRGMHGALVGDCAEQLGRWRRRPNSNPTNSDAFDGDLMQLVEQFQSCQSTDGRLASRVLKPRWRSMPALGGRILAARPRRPTASNEWLIVLPSSTHSRKPGRADSGRLARAVRSAGGEPRRRFPMWTIVIGACSAIQHSAADCLDCADRAGTRPAASAAPDWQPSAK